MDNRVIKLIELQHYLDNYLDSQSIQDYCPNGLQVQGRNDIKKIVSGVTACQALIDAAVKAKADAILVHHGYFWKGESQQITGMKYQRIHSLIQNDMSLFAYHLPLDIHTTVGNNIQLAKVLDFKVVEQIDVNDTPGLLCSGELVTEVALEDLLNHIENKLQRKPLAIKANDIPIQTIAWCTGGAQDFIFDAATLGVDAYISGEISERTTHVARELGIHYIAAGHHATERYGIQALGEHLKETFNIEHEFIDIDNPV